jgi:hypothetical protein
LDKLPLQIELTLARDMEEKLIKGRQDMDGGSSDFFVGRVEFLHGQTKP